MDLLVNSKCYLGSTINHLGQGGHNEKQGKISFRPFSYFFPYPWTFYSECRVLKNSICANWHHDPPSEIINSGLPLIT